MKIVIVDREKRDDKKYQIMSQVPYGLNHCYPGKLFTIEEAVNICNKNGWEISAVGTFWKVTG